MTDMTVGETSEDSRVSDLRRAALCLVVSVVEADGQDFLRVRYRRKQGDLSQRRIESSHVRCLPGCTELVASEQAPEAGYIIWRASGQIDDAITDHYAKPDLFVEHR